MNDPNEPPPLPAFVGYPIFPFEGDLRVRPLDAPLERDHVRSGEPGGAPCEICAADDAEYIWVDDNWRLRAPRRRTGVPVQLFLETREHVDMDELDEHRAAELGLLIVALDRAVQAVGGDPPGHTGRRLGPQPRRRRDRDGEAGRAGDQPTASGAARLTA
jgi:hypothetical protein